MPFGTRLKNLLQSRNLSQVNFASLLGITRGRLNNYIAGRSEPDYTTLRSIASLLQVSIDYLLEGERFDEANGVFQIYSGISPGSIRPQDESGPFTWIPLYEAQPTVPENGGEISPPSPIVWLQVEEKHTTPSSFKQSYALLVNDDSMYPQLQPGDILFVRPMLYSYHYLAASQSQDLFAVRLHHSDKIGLSVKLCYLKDDILIFSSCNSAFKPILYNMQKVLFVPIKGKVVSMTRSYLNKYDILKK